MDKSKRPLSAWTASPDAEYAPLKLLPKTPPTPEQAEEIRDEVQRETEQRVEAYLTPVTSETLRQSFP